MKLIERAHTTVTLFNPSTRSDSDLLPNKRLVSSSPSTLVSSPNLSHRGREFPRSPWAWAKMGSLLLRVLEGFERLYSGSRPRSLVLSARFSDKRADNLCAWFANVDRSIIHCLRKMQTEMRKWDSSGWHESTRARDTYWPALRSPHVFTLLFVLGCPPVWIAMGWWSTAT
jgi:hypothetical protein